MQNKIIMALPLAGIGAFLPGFAAEQAANLPETVVTATRSDSNQNELATATTIYTRQDIERLQVRTLPELLKGSTGIDMVQSGGYGKDTNVYMRGTNADHVLVLVDGIKVGSVTTGTTPFQFIPVDQVERVEIIRGPQSSLYGSEAIGGVIQIFTRKGGNSARPNIALEAGGGSYDSYQGSAAINGKWGRAWYSLGASQFGSQGINAQSGTTVANGFNPDRDGYNNTGLNAKAGYRFDNGAELEAFFLRAEGETEIDNATSSTTLFINQTVGASASADLNDVWRSTLRVGQSLDEADQFRHSGAFATNFDTTRWNASWLNQLNLHKTQQLTLGADYRLDQVESTTRYAENSRYDAGGFIELHSRWFERHFTNASLRWDENQAFGSSLTGNFGWRFNWDHGLSAFASFGNAFKAPTFNQLYFPGFGNPHLQAEQSTNFEGGLAGNHGWMQWEIRAYHSNIDQLIVFSGRPLTAQNIGKAQIDGIEAEISGDLLGWHNKLSMNLLTPKDRANNLRLPRRATQTLSYDVSRSFAAFDVGAAVLAQGERFDNTANTVRLGAFMTIDVRAAYHVDKHWMFSAKLNNMLDQQYQTLSTYNNFGRNFFFSIHYNY
ncbi:TonB-dependent receptor domain-containing protein [Methylomonas koyamae]|uniref:TonB-dependent receptor domain-containing protein n=1 Tax=Methylomonas koyamae TaxID=702114 RepID=UPI001C33333E|nr:TonB-dependent receptor [Methylomonas koyamae]BBL56629.1 TonB-dependent receptor [Methylomonas koyamae]